VKEDEHRSHDRPSPRPALMLTDKHRPAPLLVCTYSFGETELPTVRAAYHLEQAMDIARQEAAATCMPVVRVYSLEGTDPDTGAAVCKLVSSVRL